VRRVPQNLNTLLIVAREVYGETRSNHSEFFCQWTNDVISGTTTLHESATLRQLIGNDRDSFSGRYHLQLHRQNEVDWLYARWQACFCAINTIRAVMNKMKGMPYGKWIERALYRATLTEADIKGNK
jgi:hypothetical protein